MERLRWELIECPPYTPVRISIPAGSPVQPNERLGYLGYTNVKARYG